MAKIHVLDEQMTNLIAAGEVIERCASVVKELVENSIDALATKISISLIDSGLVEIRVTDNGCGMDNYDAKMALLPHATSKIQTKEDLFSISSLGFRGEALASILAVSNFKIITSEDGYRGTMLSVKGGIPLSEAMIAHPKGTEVIVKNLFFNTPARLQNLQSASVELSYITDYVSKMAIARPDIQFVLENNAKELIHTSGNGNLLEVVSEIFSNDVAKNMVKIFNDNGLFKIEGYVSNISQTRSNKQNIMIFVNGRLIHNSALINAIINGYGTLLMTGRYPIAILNIKIDLGMVDVNVHPSKYEVRFSNEENLKAFITETIDYTLNKTDLSPVIEDKEISFEEGQEQINVKKGAYYDPFTMKEVNPNNETLQEEKYKEDENFNENFKEEQDQNENKEEELEDFEESSDSDEESDYEEHLYEMSEDDDLTGLDESEEDDFVYEDYNGSLDFDKYEDENIMEYQDDDAEEPSKESQEEQKDAYEDVKKYKTQEFAFNDDDVLLNGNEENRLSKMYYIGQLFGTYILAQNEDNFYLIDQHAAMERINYEKILDSLSKEKSAKYELLIPFTLEYAPSEALLIRSHREDINNLGISFEDFGNNAFVIREIPIWIFRGKEKEFVEEIISKVVHSGAKDKQDLLDSLAKSLACKKSIKGNEYHSSIEIEYLLEELVKTSNPFTCPHGRPVIVKVKRTEVDKWFKRIVE